jgi:Polysaccharide deacetylase
MIAALRRHLEEMRNEADCLRRGCYPSFVAAPSPDLDPDDVPVFVFHTIEPQEFEEQLGYLADNGYQTLDCAAFWAGLTAVAEVAPKSVLLTIDDGRTSVWSHGLPLLRKYGMKAVVFLIPGYVREAASLAPTLEDVWAGRSRPDTLASRDPELMSWSEIEAAAATGLIDFQSHTLYHHRVPISGRIVDHISPQTSDALFDLPIALGQEEQLCADGVEGMLGAPIYENDSLMAGRAVYRPDPRLAEACIDYVRRTGGRAFFESSGWRRELEQLARAWREDHDDRGGFDNDDAVAHELTKGLRRARLLIEQRLPGTEVRHLCYPYTIGSDAAIRASREAGYLTNFWGVLPDRRSNRPGDDPYHCPRLKGDYLQRLPGRGRVTLAGIMVRKIGRRVLAKPVY